MPTNTMRRQLTRGRRVPPALAGPPPVVPDDPGPPGAGATVAGSWGFTRTSETIVHQYNNTLQAFELPPLRDVAGGAFECKAVFEGGGTAQSVRLVIVAVNDTGAAYVPGTILGVGAQVTIGATAAKGAVTLPWPTGITSLPPGRYAAAIWWGGTGNAKLPAEYRVGNMWRRTQTYSSTGAPPATFGTYTLSAGAPALWITYSATLPGAAGAGITSITPTETPLSTQVPNPMAGPHRWLENSSYVPLTNVAEYNRYTWDQVETTQGNYDFSVITADLSAATAAGRPFGFRIRAERAPGTWYVPSYLNSYTGSGFYNSEFVRTRWAAMLNAMGAVLDGQIAWLEAGGGQYGENAGSNWSSTTTANKYAWLDIALAAFPNTTYIIHTADEVSLAYAFAKTPKGRVGWRNDIWGRPSAANQSFTTLSEAMRYAILNAGADGRLCTGEPTPQSTADVSPLCFLNQMRFFGGHTVGSGNWAIGSYASLSSQAQADMNEAYRLSGYRFAVHRIDPPPTAVVPGAAQTWRLWLWNRGMAYAPGVGTWTVGLRLRGASSAAVTTDLNIRTLYPTQATPVLYTTSLTWPALAAGSYTLDIRISNSVYGHIALGSGTNQGSGWWQQGATGAVTVT